MQKVSPFSPKHVKTLWNSENVSPNDENIFSELYSSDLNFITTKKKLVKQVLEGL